MMVIKKYHISLTSVIQFKCIVVVCDLIHIGDHCIQICARRRRRRCGGCSLVQVNFWAFVLQRNIQHNRISTGTRKENGQIG